MKDDWGNVKNRANPPTDSRYVVTMPSSTGKRFRFMSREKHTKLAEARKERDRLSPTIDKPLSIYKLTWGKVPELTE